MKTSAATAEWSGNLKNGIGKIQFGHLEELRYSFSSRFEKGEGTSPEELIAAAHAGCYSMALSHLLDEKGENPERVLTSASVLLEKSGDGFSLTKIQLKTTVMAPGLIKENLQQYAEEAAKNCPVSKALAGAEISVEAVLMDDRGELGV